MLRHFCLEIYFQHSDGWERGTCARGAWVGMGGYEPRSTQGSHNLTEGYRLVFDRVTEPGQRNLVAASSHTDSVVVATGAGNCSRTAGTRIRVPANIGASVYAALR